MCNGWWRVPPEVLEAQPMSDTPETPAHSAEHLPQVRLKEVRMAYVPDEDRLLFTFTTGEDTEQRFWLTRKLTQSLLGATSVQLTRSTGAPASGGEALARTVLEFQESAALARQGVKAGQVNIPAGPDGRIEAMLVRRGALQPLVPEGGDAAAPKAWSLILGDGRGHGARMVLTRENMLRFRHMIQKAVAKADWGLVSADEIAEPGAPPVLN